MYRNKREDGRGFGKSSDNVCYRGSTLHFISIKIEIISVLNWVFYTFGSSYHLFTKDIQGYLSIPEHYRFQHSFPNISWRSLAGDDQKWEMWNKKEKSEKDPASKTMNSVKWPNSVSCLLPTLSTSLGTCTAIKQSGLWGKAIWVLRKRLTNSGVLHVHVSG